MPNRLAAIALGLASCVAPAAAQLPVPLTAPAPVGEPLAAPSPSGAMPPPPPTAITPPPPTAIVPPPPTAIAPTPLPPAPAPASRVFCEQTVPYRLADPESVSPSYRPFVGIWSDADWTPQLCAALIVETVQGDGTATITYAYGPLASNQRMPGGILHGTGVIRDGQLLFQNNDGSQFAFKPFYADLQGRLTTPQGQTYQAVFKKTY